MQTNGALLVIFLTFFISYAHAKDLYEFKGSDTCQLKKYENKKWEVASAAALSGKKLIIQPANGNPSLSSTKVGNDWYTAPAHCFQKADVTASSANTSVEREELASPRRATYSKNNVSEFMHQADAGVFELTPSFGYGVTTVDIKSVDAKISTSVLNPALLFEYGISPYLTLGARLNYVSAKTTVTPAVVGDSKTNGLADPSIILNGLVGSNVGNFRYGLDFSFPTASSSASNVSSGGMAFTPMLGYEFFLGQSMLGLQAKYSLKLAQKLDGGGEVTGGNTVSGALFYELNLQPSILGIAAQYVHANSHEGFADQSTFFGGNLYCRFAASESVEIVPTFEYIKYSFLGGIGGSSDLSMYSIGGSLKARFKF